MTPLATWLVLLGLIGLVALCVGSMWANASLKRQERDWSPTRDALVALAHPFPRPSLLGVEDGAAGPAARSATFDERSEFRAGPRDASTTRSGLAAASPDRVPLVSR